MQMNKLATGKKTIAQSLLELELLEADVHAQASALKCVYILPRAMAMRASEYVNALPAHMHGVARRRRRGCLWIRGGCWADVHVRGMQAMRWKITGCRGTLKGMETEPRRN